MNLRNITGRGSQDGAALGKVIAVLGWACFIAAVIIFTSQKRGLEVQLETARAQQEKLVQESVTQLRSQPTAGKSQDPDKLQRDAEDVYRLRNEVKQLRDSQKEMEQVKAHNLELQNAVGEMRRANAEMQLENRELKNVAVASQQTRAVNVQFNNRNACITNLKQIDGAIQQWALENKKTSASRVVVDEIKLYLKGGQLPACPDGGVYRITNVQNNPTCSIPGHTLE